jgi:hypothetical protein
MKIGVLGSGIVGRTLAAGFLKHGHSVMLGTRDPKMKSIRDWLAATPGASVGTFEETAKFGELLVLAALGRAVEHVLRLAGEENLADKTLIDTNNPIDETPPPQDGVLRFFTGPNESLAERIQSKWPKLRVVKAFNSVGAGAMVNPQYEQGPPTMFFCGNDDSAKTTVAKLIRQLGWEPFDCGGIIAARAIEPLCMLWCIPGFRANKWNHAFKLLER